MTGIDPDRSRIMRAVRSKNTKPEIAVRRTLHALGFRFRLHRKDLPGSPDIVLPRWRAVVFVHGCFWHGHDCPKSTIPATRPEFWEAKFRRNIERDKQAKECLKAQGWRVVVLWECALVGRGRLPPDRVAEKLASFLQSQLIETEIRGA